MVSRKLARIMRIFVEIGHIKSWVVIFWPKAIGPVFPTVLSGHDFGQSVFVTLLFFLREH
jgi:hypothetical protein